MTLRNSQQRSSDQDSGAIGYIEQLVAIKGILRVAPPTRPHGAIFSVHVYTLHSKKGDVSFEVLVFGPESTACIRISLDELGEDQEDCWAVNTLFQVDPKTSPEGTIYQIHVFPREGEVGGFAYQATVMDSVGIADRHDTVLVSKKMSALPKRSGGVR